MNKEWYIMTAILFHLVWSQNPAEVRTDNQSDGKLQEIWASSSLTLLVRKQGRKREEGKRRDKWKKYKSCSKNAKEIQKKKHHFKNWRAVRKSSPFKKKNKHQLSGENF